MINIKILSFLLSFVFVSCGAASINDESYCQKPFVVAVIDTGFGYLNTGHSANLCEYGHKDFSIDRQFSKSFLTKDVIPVDTGGHGTNVAGLIENEIKNSGLAGYCLLIIKYFSYAQSGHQNFLASLESIKYARDMGANIINYSSHGKSSNFYERRAIVSYLNLGGIFVAAVGNDGKNLDMDGNMTYPAGYDSRIVAVGSKDEYGFVSPFSNYGKIVNRWEIGVSRTAFDITMSGTSQATAVASGKIAADMIKRCK